jgi:hypothetical protein
LGLGHSDTVVSTHHFGSCLTTDFTVTPTATAGIEYPQSAQVSESGPRFCLKGRPVFVIMGHFILIPLTTKAGEMLICRESWNPSNHRKRLSTTRTVDLVVQANEGGSALRASQKAPQLFISLAKVRVLGGGHGGISSITRGRLVAQKSIPRPPYRENRFGSGRIGFQDFSQTQHKVIDGSGRHIR